VSVALRIADGRAACSTGITASEEGFNCGEYMFGKRPVLTAVVLVSVTCLILPLVYILTTRFMYRDERRETHPPLHGSSDDTEVWSLKEGFAEPEHLSIPDLTMFVPDEVVSIDEAHLRGLIHHGAYIFVLDKSLPTSRTHSASPSIFVLCFLLVLRLGPALADSDYWSLNLSERIRRFAQPIP